MADDGKVLHFKLNKVQAANKQLQYQFEGDLFPSVQALICHHLSTGQPISESSNAVISRPKSDRSQSSMSSTGSSGNGSILTKSGSRSSLLKDSPKESNGQTQQCQLKRFKSLPAGKVRRRVKRRAPSPPKDQKPLTQNRNEPPETCTTTLPPPPPSATPSSAQDSGVIRKIPSLLEGVKLRRKKFTHMLQKPITLRQRQSMHITAELRNHLRKGLTEDKRRYSMPRLLDDSDEDEQQPDSIINHKLVRSPSDTSLIYLNQMSPLANSFDSYAQQRNVKTRISNAPLLPDKKRPRSKDTAQVPKSTTMQGSPEYVNTAVLESEAIYDCLPKPRSCLTHEQIQYNEIYDVPRSLIVPKRDRPIQPRPLHPSIEAAERSMSAAAAFAQQHGSRRNLDCVSVCSLRNAQQPGQRLNRHRNFDQGLNQHDQHRFKPALPPKNNQNNGSGVRTCDEDIYNIPRKLEAKGPVDDRISLCSTFSFCSDCTDDVPDDLASSSLVTDGDTNTPFRFSPTSLLSDNSLSLHDYFDDEDDDDPSRSLLYVQIKDRSGDSHNKIMSSVSSVSSITLQGDDTLSLGYDTTSLPEDPFPEGLPSSASSTIGSPASSRSSLSEAMAAVEGQHFSRPNSENEPIMSPVETQETFETVTSSVETPLPEITDDDVDDYDDGDSGDNGDVHDDKKGGCGNGVHNEEMDTPSQMHPNENSVGTDLYKAKVSDEDANRKTNMLDTKEVPDIFNHRSSSRFSLLRKRNVRCKSQPNSLSVADDDQTVWMANEHHLRKSLSPSLLQSNSMDDAAASTASTLTTAATTTERVSLFDPTNFHSLFLPGNGNKPLDALAVSAVHRTLVDTPAPILAVHLTKVDLWLFGLLDQEEATIIGKGNLWLLCEPFNTRFGTDILERYMCLRTLVVVTVLAASNIVESARVLAKWVRVADELNKRLKNYFGCHCIASGLIDSHLMRWNQLWSELKEVHPDEWALMNGLHHCLDDPGVKLDAILVPNVVPYVTAKVKVAKGLPGSSNATFASGGLIDDVALQNCGELTAVWAKNAQTAFRHINCSDDLLLDLFRTEFHVRLFWGTNGLTDYPHNFINRHVKFAKVLAALATICARQY